jgi:hypothetical protein
VTVLDRGRPGARISRIEGGDDEVAALDAAGTVRPAVKPLPRGFLTRKLPRTRTSVTQALRDERDDRF